MMKNNGEINCKDYTGCFSEITFVTQHYLFLFLAANTTSHSPEVEGFTSVITSTPLFQLIWSFSLCWCFYVAHIQG